MSPSSPTIFALSSGAGRAGIAVVRVSGPGTADALQELTGPLPAPRKAALRHVRDPASGDLIDTGLALWFPAPASFTGEDLAELHIHGGRAVVDATLAALGRCPGLRLAEPGEFTRRAFLAGKLDLTAAEGLADLIDAETEAQRRQALRQANGELMRLYEGWRADLIEAMALVEAHLDFADEGDVPYDLAQAIRQKLAALRMEMSAHLADGRRGEILRDGFHVVLAGAPNAGKSSLLNALAQRDAAIVSPEAGTTRDVIEVRLDLGGLPVILSDTAGVRQARGAIEAEGIRRTLARASNGDLIVWVMDAQAADRDLPAELAARESDTCWVLNKSDLPGFGDALGDPNAAEGSRAHPLRLSSLTGDGIDRLVALVTAAARARLGDQTRPTLTRSRHRLEIENARVALTAALDGPPEDLELRAEDLRLAASALGRITGRVDVEHILDRIFASFCIGK